MLVESFSDNRHFYPRSPCGERPFNQIISTNKHVNFYPRSPCGERQAYSKIIFFALYFYPRSPCGERHLTNYHFTLLFYISIHALLAESDFLNRRFRAVHNAFLSTLSLRRATRKSQSSRAGIGISIHALLAESDLQNWRKPHGQKTFLSTLSLRRATSKRFPPMCSIRHFYPRSPCGERLHYDNYNLHCVEISIHALLAESDLSPKAENESNRISIHALLAESDRFQAADISTKRISIHALLAESDIRLYWRII